MRVLRYLVIGLLLLGMPAALLADVTSLPGDAKWYFHADFDKMRSTEAGRHLYGWLEEEVLSEIRDEIGVDLDKEADTLTAYAVSDERVVVVIDGRISQETEDKILAMAAESASLDQFGSGSRTYYYIKEHRGADDDAESTESEEESDGDNVDIEVDGFEDGAYLTFAVKNKLIVASNREDIEALIANKGRIDAGDQPRGALFVLSAERSLMQAGVQAGELGDEIGWDSNILRNTEQAALLIADEDGMLSVEAQLVASEKEMVDSLANIVRGLISLQIFNDDLDPDFAEVLQRTSVSVDDTTLVVKVVLDPQKVVEAL